jgi:transposase
MATIQPKISRGHKYWYIVESRRINGKPRPVVLAYLGKANDLLKRLQGITESVKVKSYSHGGVSALLNVAHKLDVVSIINKHIKSRHSYISEKPIRNKLTAGITFLLGAIGRVCHPTSKNSFYNWAKQTSLEYLLRCNLSNLDSQHFWDLMNALPIESIEKIESELVRRVIDNYEIEPDTLFFDTTNFYTYINSTNTRCQLAMRGKNKQKRNDLRQIGLAMVVSDKSLVPLIHQTYSGNINDTIIFRELIIKIKKRIIDLGLNLEDLTLVFDRGNNSKKNMKIVKGVKLHYVGALTPYHHKRIIKEAEDHYKEVNIDDNKLMVFRDKREIWGEERTILVYVSDKLKAGQIRGIYQTLAKKEKELQKLKESLSNPKSNKRKKIGLEEKIKKIVKGQFIKGVIDWSLTEKTGGKFLLDFSINEDKLGEIEDELGFRILMTDRHEWANAKIIKAYNGQSRIENAFKHIKNPYHLAFIPEFHWTDHNIKVHFFICILGYLLATIVQRQVELEKAFTGTLNRLLDILNNIRLATLLEESKTRGKVKAVYKLEEMSNQERRIVKALCIEDFHIKRPKLKGVGVYI